MTNSLNIDIYNRYNQLSKLLTFYNNKEVVFFCVGNYKVWFDCFASSLAIKLKTIAIRSFIYGGKDFPITPDNLCEYMDFVNKKHPKACIIVIDNLLTFSEDECGQLVINNRSTNLAYFSKNVTFGNISILLKTYPYKNSYDFLHKQSKIVDDIVDMFKLLIKNNKIE